MIRTTIRVAVIVVSLVLASTTGCSNDDEAESGSCAHWSTTCVDKLPADKQVDELSADEESCLCNWYAVQVLGLGETTCDVSGEESESVMPGLLKACSDPTEPHLPCAVKDLLACVEAYVSEPCGAADALPCQALGECVDAKQPPENDIKDFLCADRRVSCYDSNTVHYGFVDFPMCLDQYYFFFWTCTFCTCAGSDANGRCREKFPSCDRCYAVPPYGYKSKYHWCR